MQTQHKEGKIKGRKYTLKFTALDKDINWELMEHQLFRLAEDVERVCSVPVDIKMTNFNSSLSEQYIRRGRILEDWKSDKEGL